ncbi:MAG: hypothetical protein HZB92_06535 [Euryarchaeota archaeon]|nr:hypothetical protein [Euryarchaeota archaeon]
MAHPYPGYDRNQSRARDTLTESGLKSVIYGMYFQIMSFALSLAMAFYLLNALSSMLSSPQQTLSSIGPLLAFSALSVLLLIAVIIFFTIGLFRMHKGRREFGDAHRKRVDKAMTFVVVYILLVIAGAIAVAVITAASMMSNMNWLNQTNATSGFQFISSYVSSLRISILVSGALGVASSVVVSLVAINLVRGFCDEKHTKMMSAGLVVYSIAPAVGAAISYYALARFESLDASTLSNFSSLSGFGSAVSFAGLVLFLIGFRHAYHRINNGDIKPVPEPSFQQQWIPYYPPPYPIYPPPQQHISQPSPPVEPEKKEEPPAQK